MDFINRKNDPSFLIADFKKIFPAGHYVCCMGIGKVCNNQSVRERDLPAADYNLLQLAGCLVGYYVGSPQNSGGVLMANVDMFAIAVKIFGPVVSGILSFIGSLFGLAILGVIN